MELKRSHYDPALFQGTAWYYTRYRTPYPPELFGHLARTFRLGGGERALDLGCGTGQLAIPLAHYVGRVIAMDPAAEMLTEGSKAAAIASVDNIDFVLGSSWDISSAMGEFRLATMGESFHWMDRDKTLQILYDMILPGGGVAIASKNFRTTPGYQEVIDAALKKFLGEKRRAGQGYYSHPQDRHETVLARSPFNELDIWMKEYERDWTVDDAIGYLYSTSYSSKRLLGSQAKHFESELREKLLQLSPSGVFKMVITVSTLLGSKAPR